jgi:acyl-CoA thioesterase FadM
MLGDSYTMVQDLVAPGDPGSHYHLLDWQTGEMITSLWSQYLLAARESAPYGDAVPAPRRVTTVLERECFPGDRLRRGIRAVSRSRRSFVCEAAVWLADTDALVVTEEIVTVVASRSTGQAIEIPADLWAGIERLEGRSLPLVQRA